MASSTYAQEKGLFAKIGLGEGYGLNISIDKEWLFGKRWAVQLGPQLF